MRSNNIFFIIILVLATPINAAYAFDLHAAARGGKNQEIISYLAKNPQAINELYFDRTTALYEAVEDRNADTVLLLLRKGADVNAAGEPEDAPIFASVENIILSTSEHCILDMLLVAGVDLEVKNRNGETPLHRVVIKDRMWLIEKLLLAGANIESRDDQGYTPLMIAVAKNNMGQVRLLIEFGAEIKKDKKVIRRLIKKNNNKKMFEYLNQHKKE